MKTLFDTEEVTPPEEETALPPTQKETLKDDPESDSSISGKALSRKEKRKRSLLLQFGSCAAAALMVLQGFGIDYLSVDGLFNESVLFAEVASEENSKEEILPESGEPADDKETDVSRDSDREKTESEASSPASYEETEETDAAQGTDDENVPDESDPGETDIIEEKQPVTDLQTIGQDKSNPLLPNPRPNAYVPGQGILNEEGIFVEDEEISGYIYANAQSGKDVISVEGLSYDRNTNVLTMKDYHGRSLHCSLMGNGFTIRAEGDNELEEGIVLNGFYTGGSVKFTGDGTLKVNVGEKDNYGVYLNAEYSQTCLMVDRSVTLAIGGSISAVAASATNAGKMIYYVSDELVPDMTQTAVKAEASDNEAISDAGYQDWVLTIGESGSKANYIEFTPDLGGAEDRIPMETALAWREIVTLTKENFWDYFTVREVTLDSGYEGGLTLATLDYKYPNICAHYDNYPHHMYDTDGDIETVFSLTIRNNRYGGTRTYESTITIYADQVIASAGSPKTYGSYPSLTALKGKYDGKAGLAIVDLSLLSYELVSVTGKVEVWHFPENLKWHVNSRGKEYLWLVDRKGNLYSYTRELFCLFTGDYLKSRISD